MKKDWFQRGVRTIAFLYMWIVLIVIATHLVLVACGWSVPLPQEVIDSFR